MNKTLLLLMALFFCGVRLCFATSAGVPLAAIEAVQLDGEAIAYATFQSHNQKVVSNKRGIFTTHIRTSNRDYSAQQWRLSHSTDGGKSFSTVFDTTEPTGAPAIETGSQNNLYLIRPHFKDGNAYFDRFMAGTGFSSPKTAVISHGSAGKYAMVLDEKRRQFYYFVQNKWFHIIGMDGKVRYSESLLKAGPMASMMYPLLTLGDDGTLYAAWYTQQHGIYIYRGIYAACSRDGGRSWHNFDGQPLPLPIVDDDSGPATMISRPDHFDVHTILNGFLVKEAKLNFSYMVDSSPEQTIYVRYDTKIMKRDLETHPFFQGRDGTRMNNSGYFCAHPEIPGSTLYYVTGDRTKLICFASDDEGETWYDYAVGDKSYPINKKNWHGVYSVGGARQITEDDFIVGTFTEVADFAKTYYEPRSGKVHFFRIQGGLSRAEVVAANYDEGKLKIQFDRVRGQPDTIRFGMSDRTWSKWMPFTEDLTATFAKRPVTYQLKSRLGVINKKEYLSYSFADDVTQIDPQKEQKNMPEKPYIILERGDVRAVVVNNDAVDDAVLPDHREGYSGVAHLSHKQRPENLFVPNYGGMNFEFIHDGTTKNTDILFEPRRAPMSIRQVDAHTAELYQSPTPNWKLESWIRYTLLENGTIELTLDCIPHERTFKNNYIGLFFASYIDRPECKDIHFLGHRTDDVPGKFYWVQAMTPSHGVLPTHLAVDDQRPFFHDDDFPVSLIINRSNYRYARPWYYGVSHGMALVQLFREQDKVRFTQSPTGGGNDNPAWDFQWFIEDYEVGKRYQFMMRAMLVPFESADQIRTLVEKENDD